MSEIIKKNESYSFHKVNEYGAIIPEKKLDQTFMAVSEKEAEKMIIKMLREKFNTMSDEELIDGLGIIMWDENEPLFR